MVSALGPEPRTYRLNAIVDCPVPIVAAIQGACFGGGLEIAVACNLRIAAQGARLGAPVGRMGFPLALGETEGLFRLVGPSVSAELLIDGRLFDARTAREKGLVTRVVEAERHPGRPIAQAPDPAADAGCGPRDVRRTNGGVRLRGERRVQARRRGVSGQGDPPSPLSGLRITGSNARPAPGIRRSIMLAPPRQQAFPVKGCSGCSAEIFLPGL